MKKIITQLPEIKLVGITVRTNNKIESYPETAKIGTIVQRFFGENLQNKILDRKNPRTVLAVYTDYESDASGEYTYFIGEEVTSFDKVDEIFRTLTVPPQTYAKFTFGPDRIPQVVIDAWQKIWKMDKTDLGGERGYIADIEVYDERSVDHNRTIFDMYIGIKTGSIKT